MNLCFGLFQLYLDYQLFSFRLSSEELSFHLFYQTKKLLSLCCGIPYGFSSQSLRCVVIQRCCRNEGRLYYSYCLVLAAWLIFFDARYLNANRFIKSAIIVLIASVWTAFADDICEFLIFGTRQITIKSVNFSDWTSNICVNANVYAIVLVSGIIIASILFVAGGIKAFANKK